MANRTRESVLAQVQSELKGVRSAKGLPFRDVLSESRIAKALNRHGVTFRERVYTPTVTLWAFLSQLVARELSSCVDAVSRVIADRIACGKPKCSSNTSSYCKARGRLPLKVIQDLVREVGQQVHREALSNWLWLERRVVIVDGSTSTMEDTPENQEEYPQSKNQRPGLGFPILRFVVLFSLSTGVVLDCAIAGCRGKQTGEQSLFRQLWLSLDSGDIVLGDRLYDSYRDIALLKRKGVDSVFGKRSSRKCDFRKGRKLGLYDHVVSWQKPGYNSTRYASREEWESLPPTMEMRESRITVMRPGYKTRTVIIVTTLVDADKYPLTELMSLFAQRWYCELDLRSIKRSLGMTHLNCKTPEAVRKELWTYLLAYNAIRARMAEAAATHDVEPRMLSFTAAKTLINAITPLLQKATGDEYARIEKELLHAIAAAILKKRPGRKEPRAVKRRPQTYPSLTKPRSEARKGLKA
jgi:hypothetical protein